MALAGIPIDQLLGHGSTVTIAEQTGPRPGTNGRKVVLSGSAQPKKPAPWGGTSTIVKTVYPGNPVASQQVLSDEYSDSAWEGTWRRTMFNKSIVVFTDENGEDHRIAEPWDLVEVMESIIKAGALLRVTWGITGTQALNGVLSQPTDVQRKKVRLGRCTSRTWNFQTHCDLTWNMTFDWVSDGDLQDRASKVLANSDAKQAADALAAFFTSLTNSADAKFINAVKSFPKSPNTFTLGKLEQLAGFPEKSIHTLLTTANGVVKTFRDVANIALKAANQPLAVENQLTSFATNVVAMVNQYHDDFGNISFEHKSETSRPSACVRAQVRGAEILDQARDGGITANEIIEKAAARVAQQSQATVRASSQTRAGDVLGIHVCRGPDTPQSVSMRWYHTPSNAIAILKMNRLAWHTPAFRRGQILIIPTVSGVDARTRV